MIDKKLTLYISHHIYLTREQRYALSETESVDAMGVYVPMWVGGREATSISKEFFAEYSIFNDSTALEPLVFNEDGRFFINLPQKKDLPIPYLSNEEWLLMSKKDKEHYHKSSVSQKHAGLLKDTKDKGCEYLCFNFTQSKNYFGMIATQMHTVIIQDISVLKKYMV